ncbi:MAG: hypothetical protein GDA38_08630 [Hormoscilla sp. SP12CHS1]|nr:hypothetical protein [Hormoscilla sp. SP12CHS1]
MSDIFVMTRNQDNIALTSIDGIAFVALLLQAGQVLAKETVELIYADAGFDDLPVGLYTVTVRHEGMEPRSATRNVTISREDEVILLTFVYLEPERVLLRLQTAVEKRL